MRLAAAALALTGCTLIFGDERNDHPDNDGGGDLGRVADLSIPPTCVFGPSLSVGTTVGTGESRMSVAATGKSWSTGPFLAAFLGKDGGLHSTFFFDATSSTLTKNFMSCAGCADLMVARTTGSELPVAATGTPLQLIAAAADLSSPRVTPLACPPGSSASRVGLVRDALGVLFIVDCADGFHGTYIPDGTGAGDMSHPALPPIAPTGVHDLHLTRTFDGGGYYVAMTDAAPGGKIFVESITPSTTTSFSSGTTFATMPHMGPLGFDVSPGPNPVALVAVATPANDLAVALGDPGGAATKMGSAHLSLIPLRPLSVAAGIGGFVVGYDDGASLNTVFVGLDGTIGAPVRIVGLGGSGLQVTYDVSTNSFGLSWVHDDGIGNQTAWVGRLVCL